VYAVKQLMQFLNVRVIIVISLNFRKKLFRH
jgi:hypothetical protein